MTKWLVAQIVKLSVIFLAISLGGIWLVQHLAGRPATGPEGLVCEAIALLAICVYSFFAYVR